MTVKAHILVVDDDRNLLELLVIRLESAGYAVTSAMNGRDAVLAVRGGETDLAVIDLQLADTEGLSLMEELRAINSGMPAIILTAHGSIENAVEAMRRGAFNYLAKPFDAANLLMQVGAALENRRLISEVKRLRALMGEQLSISGIVSKSRKMEKVLEQVSMVAGLDATVLVQGESGTGKELIARVIHQMSGRRDGAFVGMNCAAIPHSLLEKELFGHAKGAFTGAH
ncbi:MAG: sigma 54-interacting transcriptional regulator, partial [Nitrospirota bacterium]|nr:sigma 54-interacting transcriptional regulator [Nitrospirota bacterium]